jgi:mono/diheme cytochrome c family protein
MEDHKTLTMKKHSTYLWLVPIVLLNVIGCSVRKSEPVKQKEFVPQNERIANGEKVYMKYCQSCHPGGEGGLGPSISANPAPQFVKRFQMRHGLGVMPGFKKGEISKNDLRDISKFLKAWKSY